MGCWCETCGITQLPINAGDKVRVFVMVSQDHYSFEEGGAGGGGTCYSNDRWTPIGPAIQGKYDDYGGIEKIVMDENAKMIEDRLTKGWVPVTSEYDGDDVPEKLGLPEYLHFIERDRGKFKPEFREEQHLGLMFVLEDVYQAMINFDSIEAHHYWDGTEEKRRGYEYMPLSKGLMLEFQGWYEKQLDMVKLRGSKEEDRFYELLADMDNGRIFSSYREDGLKIFKKPFQLCAQEQMPYEHKKVQKLINSALEMLRFQIAMSRARKQWIPQSGKGGQNNELDIYQAINAASNKIIEARQKENFEDGGYVPDENGYYPYMIEHNQEGQNAKKGK